MSWVSPSNTKIVGRGWDVLPAENRKGVIIICHGLGEHIGRYEHLASFFNHYGFVVMGSDRSGHGRSGNKRGHINQYQDVFFDIDQNIHYAQNNFTGLPIFLYGQSMGGGIVIDYLLNHYKESVRGIIASSPLLEPGFKPPAALLFIAKMLRKVYPGFSQGNQLDLSNLCRDQLVIEAYKKDPLVHDKITSETAVGMLHSGSESLASRQTVPCPLLLMHGDKDKLTSPTATMQFASHIKGDVKLKIWEGFYHELHNEPEKLEVLEYAHQWILEKI